MKDTKRSILKDLLSGRIGGQQAAAQLKNGGKTTVVVWVEGFNKLWKRLGSDEVLTRAELLEKRKREDPYGYKKVITIGGKKDE